MEHIFAPPFFQKKKNERNRLFSYFFNFLSHSKLPTSIVALFFLQETLQVIKEHAWVASELPLILSLENHLSLPQQDLFADMLIEIFNEELVQEPLSNYPVDDLERLPSPLDLNRKVLIKGKKVV